MFIKKNIASSLTAMAIRLLFSPLSGSILTVCLERHFVWRAPSIWAAQTCLGGLMIMNDPASETCDNPFPG